MENQPIDEVYEMTKDGWKSTGRMEPMPLEGVAEIFNDDFEDADGVVKRVWVIDKTLPRPIGMLGWMAQKTKVK